MVSCYKGNQKTQEVYRNDFESNNLTGISNGSVTQFNGSKVLGRYNAGGFIVALNQLPQHDLVQVSFDLFIHDSWDGNTSGDQVGGPDIWEMEINGSKYIYATFSNMECPPQTCTPQSYPANYPNNNRFPKTGAYRTDLPGACSLSGHIGGTTQYKIEKTIVHKSGSLNLQCLDQLKQINTADPKCDESWSVDNIIIKVIKLN